MRDNNRIILFTISAFALFGFTSNEHHASAKSNGSDPRLRAFIQAQVSARLYNLEIRKATPKVCLDDRSPSAAVDLIPKDEDISLALKNLSPAGKEMADRITTAIFKEGAVYNFDPITVYTIVDQESSVNVKAIGSVGERGLIQIRPSTAKAVAAKMRVPFSSDKLFEPEYNLHVGLAYLQTLKKKYKHYESAYLDAYNMGPTKMIARTVASKSRLKQFVYSINLERRRNLLLTKFNRGGKSDQLALAQ